MKLNNFSAICLLVGLELAVELTANYLQKGIEIMPYPIIRRTVADGLICMTMMTVIIALMLIIEPKLVERFMLAIYQQLRKTLKKCRAMRKSKTTL